MIERMLAKKAANQIKFLN